MDARKLILPGLVFFAGAVFGRVFGVRPLVKGVMAATTMAGMLPDTRERADKRPAGPQKVIHRPARGRAARRSSKAA